MKFINPFTDVGFKRIFGQEINKDLLIDFLNSLFEGEKHITDIKFLDKEILRDTVENRNCIYDIYCTNQDGEQFIVEMQNRNQYNFAERALFYLSQAIVRQGEQGSDWRFNLKAVYGIFFMNFKMAKLHDDLRTDVVLANKATNEQFSDKVQYIFLQLPSFRKEENECETDFERWIYVLKNMETFKRLPFQAQNAVFKRLEDIVDIASMSKEDRLKYDESIKVYRDNLVTEQYATEKGLKEGFKKGFDKGIEEGRQEGLKQGMEQGMKQGVAESTRSIALNMKLEGISPEIISKVTGLTTDEITQLQ